VTAKIVKTIDSVGTGEEGAFVVVGGQPGMARRRLVGVVVVVVIEAMMIELLEWTAKRAVLESGFQFRGPTQQIQV